VPTLPPAPSTSPPPLLLAHALEKLYNLQPELLRRARIWDEQDWRLIEMWQTWKPGEVGRRPVLLRDLVHFLLLSAAHSCRLSVRHHCQPHMHAATWCLLLLLFGTNR
jgi:hypothetical protein